MSIDFDVDEEHRDFGEHFRRKFGGRVSICLYILLSNFFHDHFLNVGVQQVALLVTPLLRWRLILRFLLPLFQTSHLMQRGGERSGVA